MAQKLLIRRLGQAVRKRRLAEDMSQEALAAAASVHPTYISLIERGLRDPKLSSIRKLAVALNTTAGELVSDAELGSKARK